jgi:hypothetical protein
MRLKVEGEEEIMDSVDVQNPILDAHVAQFALPTTRQTIFDQEGVNNKKDFSGVPARATSATCATNSPEHVCERCGSPGSIRFKAMWLCRPCSVKEIELERNLA